MLIGFLEAPLASSITVIFMLRNKTYFSPSLTLHSSIEEFQEHMINIVKKEIDPPNILYISGGNKHTLMLTQQKQLTHECSPCHTTQEVQL